MVNLVARVSNRVMIGVPGCRDKKFLAKQVTLATTVISLSQVLNWFPQFIKPCVSYFSIQQHQVCSRSVHSRSVIFHVFSLFGGGTKAVVPLLTPHVASRIQYAQQVS